MSASEILNIIVNVLNWLATNLPIEAIVASGLLSTALLGPQKLVKKWFDHNEQVMILLVGVGGVLIAGANYLITTPSENPSIIALQGLALAFGSQPFYFIVVKPASRAIGAWVTARVAEAAELKLARQAAVPAGSVLSAPVVNDVVAPAKPGDADFSH